MSHQTTPTALFVLLSALSSGCAQGQTGGEIGANDGEEHDASGGYNCREVDRASVSDDDEDVSGPSTLAELIAMVEGEFETDMVWNQREGWADVVVSPEGETTQLTIKIETIEGSGQLIDREKKQDGNTDDEGQELLDIYYGAACPDRLSVDANVSIKSANGALDEEWTATFWTQDGIMAQADIPVDLDAINGSFNVDVSALDNAAPIQTSLGLALAFGGIKGSLSGLVEIKGEDAVSAGSLEYGRFPAENRCEYGFALPDDADLVKQTQTLLDEHTSFDFSWSDETQEQSLAVNSSVQALCYQGADYQGAATFSGQLTSRVLLSDGSIDATWPLSATLELDESGALSSVHAFRDAYFADTFDVAQFEEESGISGIESNADSLSFTFGYQVHADESLPSSGELTILEVEIPACASGKSESQPLSDGEADSDGEGDGVDNGGSDSNSGSEPDVSDPEQGGGSAGCQGPTVGEIKNAQFVSVAE